MIQRILNKIKNIKKLSNDEKRELFEREFEKLKNENSFPIINDGEVSFIYKGEGVKIQITGDFTSWATRIDLKQLPETDFFYYSTKFPLDARLDYKFVVDERIILDPLNQNVIGGGFGENSFLKLKEYKENPHQIYREETPKGNVIQHNFYSNFLKEERILWVYLPPNYNHNTKYKTIYFQDGNEYMRLGNAVTTINNLINNKLINEVIAVFVEPKIRHLDYLFNSDYVDFFVKEIVNFIDNSYSTSKDCKDRFIVGDSLGGVVSTYIVYKYPNYFNGILSHSGAFPLMDKKSIAYRGDIYKGDPFLKKLSTVTLPEKWYLLCGTFEKKVALTLDLTKGNIEFYNYLKDKKLAKNIELKLYNEGHSWGLWKNTLPEGLIWLLN